MSAQIPESQEIAKVGNPAWKPGVSGNPAQMFKPGESGNPGGMPKGTPSVTRAILRIISLSPDERATFQPADDVEKIALARLKDAAHSIVDLDEPKLAAGVLKATEFVTNRIDGPLEKRITIDTSQEASVRREVRNRYQQAMEMNEAVASASHCQHCGRIVSLSDERIKEIIVNQFPPQLQGIVVQELEGNERA